MSTNTNSTFETTWRLSLKMITIVLTVIVCAALILIGGFALYALGKGLYDVATHGNFDLISEIVTLSVLGILGLAAIVLIMYYALAISGRFQNQSKKENAESQPRQSPNKPGQNKMVDSVPFPRLPPRPQT